MSALQNCCMEGESKPNCHSLKALSRKERDLVVQTGRYETRMLNGNRELPMVQTKDMEKETGCY